MECKATMTVMEMAAYLGISRSKAYEIAKKKVIPILRMGRAIRIPKKALDEWMIRESMILPEG